MARNQALVSVEAFTARFDPPISKQAVYRAVKAGKLTLVNGKIALDIKAMRYKPKVYKSKLQKLVEKETNLSLYEPDNNHYKV